MTVSANRKQSHALFHDYLEYIETIRCIATIFKGVHVQFDFVVFLQHKARTDTIIVSIYTMKSSTSYEINFYILKCNTHR
jgi:hypothetical protein